MTETPDDYPLTQEELEIVRALRELVLGNAGTAEVNEDVVAAYVMGSATKEQAGTIRSALSIEPQLRKQVLELIRKARSPSTVDERTMFDRANAPPMSTHSTLAAFAGQLSDSHLRPSPKLIPQRRRLEWLLGGWALTATAATCAILIVFSERQEGRGVAGAPGGNGPEPPAVAQSEFSLDTSPTISLQPPMRASARTMRVSVIQPGTKTIRLQAYPPDVPDHSLLRVTLIGPGGLLLQKTRPVEDFFPRNLLTLHSSTGFRSGSYQLTLAGTGDYVKETLRYDFEIKINRSEPESGVGR